MDTGDKDILEELGELRSSVEALQKEITDLKKGVFARLDSVGEKLEDLAATIHTDL